VRSEELGKRSEKVKKVFLFVSIFFILYGGVWAQDFGFGFGSDEESETSKPGVTFSVSGEMYAEAAPYFDDFLERAELDEISAWNVKLNLELASSYIDVFASFNFNAASIGELWSGSEMLKETNYTPLIINEAFLRGYIGPVNIEAGYRKLTWGRADSNGPLDITNPVDFSDLRNITDIMGNKIARPMVRVTWNAGAFSKLEGVFIPNFSGHRFAETGRWAPSQYTNMMSTVETGIFARADENYGFLFNAPGVADIFDGLFNTAKGEFQEYFDNNPVSSPSSKSIDYFQAGLRFTTTIGSADIGAQYFYGNFMRPSFTLSGVDNFLDDIVNTNMAMQMAGLLPSYTGNPALLAPQIKYNRYHQIGIDYAQVLFGFNVRAELAFHLTEDLNGSDGSVQNPFIGWSLGFDRDLFWGINLNMISIGTVRLFHDKVNSNPVIDAEAGTNMTSTRLSVQLSKKFLRDNLETKATVIWDIENMDFYIIPAIVWISGNLTSEISAGFFTGNEDGELGQYRKNSFLKLCLTYSF